MHVKIIACAKMLFLLFRVFLYFSGQNKNRNLFSQYLEICLETSKMRVERADHLNAELRRNKRLTASFSILKTLLVSSGCRLWLQSRLPQNIKWSHQWQFQSHYFFLLKRKEMGVLSTNLTTNPLLQPLHFYVYFLW